MLMKKSKLTAGCICRAQQNRGVKVEIKNVVYKCLMIAACIFGVSSFAGAVILQPTFVTSAYANGTNQYKQSSSLNTYSYATNSNGSSYGGVIGGSLYVVDNNSNANGFVSSYASMILTTDADTILRASFNYSTSATGSGESYALADILRSNGIYENVWTYMGDKDRSFASALNMDFNLRAGDSLILKTMARTYGNGWAQGSVTNVAYTDNPVTPVPEPGAMLLLSSGLLGLIVIRKKA